MEQHEAFFTPMTDIAVSMHESFMSFVDAGFTREEALTIVLKMLEIFKPGA